MVENAGVDVDAAVVFGGFDVVAHVRRLRVFAEDGIVVGGAREQPCERTAYAVYGRAEDLRADEPVGLVRGLAEQCTA